MKYKFELWKYRDIEMEEAAAHLNEMAAKGWEFFNFTSYPGDIAVYRRNENSNISFATDLYYWDRDENKLEEYYSFYKDLGWTNIHTTKKGLSFFRSEKGETFKPMFTDDMSKLDRMNAYLKDNFSIGKQILSGIFMLAIALGFSYVFIIMNHKLNPVSLFIIVVAAIEGIIFLLDAVASGTYMSKANKCGELYESKLMNAADRIVNYSGYICLLSVWIVGMIGLWYLLENMANVELGTFQRYFWLIVGIVNIPAPITISVSIYLKLVKDMKTLGNILISVFGAFPLYYVISTFQNVMIGG